MDNGARIPNLHFSHSSGKWRQCVEPSGAVWLSHPGGGTLLGNVVEAGRKVVLGGFSANSPIGGIADPIAYALTAADARGRRMADEFAVEKVSRVEYDAAMARDRAEREK
jgi:hypothetical protein